MKVTCERSSLAQALGVASRAVSARNTLPILSHVLLEASADGPAPDGGGSGGRLSLTATDLDTAIRCALPANVGHDGSLAVPAASLLDYISKLPDAPVTLEAGSGGMVVRCGASRFTLPVAPFEDFPVVPQVQSGTMITLPAAVLREMIRLTEFAASTESSRSLLMGVLFEARGDELTLVATDTHRLAWKKARLEQPVETPVSAVVPARPLGELARVLRSGGDEAITVRFGASQVSFESVEASLVSRLLDGQFPSYEKVIPKSFERRARFEREALLSAVRRVEIVARHGSNKMLASFSGSLLRLGAQNAVAGDVAEEVPIAFDGDDLDIAFNAKYLSEVLALLPGDEWQLELNGPLQPGILRPCEGDDFLYIVMPMQA